MGRMHSCVSSRLRWGGADAVYPSWLALCADTRAVVRARARARSGVPAGRALEPALFGGAATGEDERSGGKEKVHALLRERRKEVEAALAALPPPP